MIPPSSQSTVIRSLYPENASGSIHRRVEAVISLKVVKGSSSWWFSKEPQRLFSCALQISKDVCTYTVEKA